MSSYPVRALPLGEAADRLLAADALEQLSALTHAVPFVIDGASVELIAEDRLSAALAVLATVAVPTIAQGLPRPGSAASRLAERCDVVVDGVAGTDLVLEIVNSHPVASTAFVQLLRHSEGCDVHEALVAESYVYAMLQSGAEFADWLSRHPRKPAPAYAEAAVIASRDGDRLLLELNRPERANAYSAAMRDALCEGLDIAIADDSISAVEIRGRGSDFSAGGDLDEFGTATDPAAAHLIRSTRHAGRSIAAIADRVTVHVQGACIGAGIELPAFAAKIVAHPDAFFQLPELAMGLIPGAGGTASIPKRIGRQRTAWLGLTRRRLTATQALEWGLIDEIYE
jgi:enoyl-CoA hydratase